MHRDETCSAFYQNWCHNTPAKIQTSSVWKISGIITKLERKTLGINSQCWSITCFYHFGFVVGMAYRLFFYRFVFSRYCILENLIYQLSNNNNDTLAKKLLYQCGPVTINVDFPYICFNVCFPPNKWLHYLFFSFPKFSHTFWHPELKSTWKMPKSQYM